MIAGARIDDANRRRPIVAGVVEGLLGSQEMTCCEVVAFLADYLSGALPAAQRAVFDRHLGACPECVAYVTSYEEAVRLSKASLAPADSPVAKDVPEELVQAILAARKERPQ